MFFFTYLGRELRRRMKQAIVISLGLALGVGLVITVAAASSGVKKAQGDVLSSLYGVGTDITVTKTPSPPKGGGSRTRIQFGGPTSGKASSGPVECTNGKCRTLTGGKIENLTSTSYATLSQSSVAGVARLHDVASAVGGLLLTATDVTIPSQSDPNVKPPTTFSVDGVDIGHPGLGPLSSGTLRSGRTLASADADSDVAVVDSDYATANKLKVGSAVSIAKKSFKVIGIVGQPQGSGAPDVYIPLARAQALATSGPGSTTTLKGDVNTIYVSAASAADIATVRKEISSLLPHATVTTASSLANQITGSASSAAKLADDLGRWLSVLVLIAAFAVASLLTVAAVTRRVREFGTLKALGWRGRRLIAQVLGESITTGIIGGAIGIGLGFAGAELITKIAPKLSATYTQASGQHFFNSVGGGPGGPTSGSLSPNVPHTVSVPLIAQVGTGAVIAALLLAVLGGLLAGALGSWRIGRLRPAVALATVE
ncbi:MAG TPA: ABC transporter permease [Streptosporangiaceae bacterium]|jgi:putative ABC transport system permease protein|nr:ABC transporter permease [Streptosporangiaceae bacterium]